MGLHSHYRTVAENAAALGLPEAFLGLVPGWGGTQLLPNIIGASNAVNTDGGKVWADTALKRFDERFAKPTIGETPPQ